MKQEKKFNIARMQLAIWKHAIHMLDFCFLFFCIFCQKGRFIFFQIYRKRSSQCVQFAPYLIYTILFLSIYLTTIMHVFVCVSNIRYNSKMFKCDILFLFTIVKMVCVRANCQMNLLLAVHTTRSTILHINNIIAYNDAIVN